MFTVTYYRGWFTTSYFIKQAIFSIGWCPIHKVGICFYYFSFLIVFQKAHLKDCDSLWSACLTESHIVRDKSIKTVLKKLRYFSGTSKWCEHIGFLYQIATIDAVETIRTNRTDHPHGRKYVQLNMFWVTIEEVDKRTSLKHPILILLQTKYLLVGLARNI